jgi:hypothetical protein
MCNEISLLGNVIANNGFIIKGRELNGIMIVSKDKLFVNGIKPPVESRHQIVFDLLYLGNW